MRIGCDTSSHHESLKIFKIQHLKFNITVGCLNYTISSVDETHD